MKAKILLGSRRNNFGIIQTYLSFHLIHTDHAQEPRDNGDTSFLPP
jgi:hypothetical protein